MTRISNIDAAKKLFKNESKEKQYFLAGVLEGKYDMGVCDEKKAMRSSHIDVAIRQLEITKELLISAGINKNYEISLIIEDLQELQD